MTAVLIACLVAAVAGLTWLLATRFGRAPQVPRHVLEAAVLDAVAQAGQYTDDRAAAVFQATADRLAAVARDQLTSQARVADQVLAGRQEAIDRTLAGKQELIDHVLASREEQIGHSLQAAQAMLDQSLSARHDAMEARLGEVQTNVRTDIDRLTAAVAQMHEATAQRFGAVDNSLRSHAEVAQALASTTSSLREALASSNARGQWGERLAEDVLRAAGLREGLNYHKRTALAGEATGIPDFTFVMPKGQVLFMDVKFPMAAYLKYLDASSDAERSAHRAAFLRDVRGRIRELAKRQYATSDERPSVDSVLLFLPNESLSTFIFEADSSIIDEAMRDSIVLCSPMTLFVVLGVIRQAFDNFALEQTSNEILGLLGKFDQQWDKYTDTVERVRRQFETVARSFDELATTRKRALERPLTQIEDLRRRRGLPVDGQMFALDSLDDADALPSNVRELGA